MRVRQALGALGLSLVASASLAQALPPSPAPHHASPAPSASATDPLASGNEVRVLNQPSGWSSPEATSTAESSIDDMPVTSSSEGVPPGGTLVEVTSGMPPATSPGPAPTFQALDVNGDGQLTPEEASAYPLLANDFLYASQNKRAISPSRYAWWLKSL